MSQDLHDESVPPFDLKNRIDGAKAAVSALPDISVFEEDDLKAMRQVFAEVCNNLKIHPESDDAQRAALAVIRHARAGAAESAQLAHEVEAELKAERQMSDA